jgi:hypothetical protein
MSNNNEILIRYASYGKNTYMVNRIKEEIVKFKLDNPLLEKVTIEFISGQHIHILPELIEALEYFVDKECQGVVDDKDKRLNCPMNKYHELIKKARAL